MPTLGHSLCNPNQLRHHGTRVQDNPYSDTPMSVTTSDDSFTACLQSKGTDIFLTTWAPSHSELSLYPHITLCSAQLWNPRAIKFPGISSLEQEEIEMRNVRAVNSAVNDEAQQGPYSMNEIRFDLSQFRRSIVSSARITADDLDQMTQETTRKLQAVAHALPPISDMLTQPKELHQYSQAH